MRLKRFIELCRDHTAHYDTCIGRQYNQDSFGRWVREGSYYLTYIFYRLGFKGHYVMFLHFGFDAVALYFVATGEPLFALAMWLIAHVADNCDGSLARYRGEADERWGQIDVMLHTWGQVVFWCILAARTDIRMIVVLLATRVVTEWHRGGFKTGERYGERSRLWKWAAQPTNVNIMYAAYAVFAVTGFEWYYVFLYMWYFVLIAVGQSAAKIWEMK